MKMSLNRWAGVIAGLLVATSTPPLGADPIANAQNGAELRATAERGNPKAQADYGNALTYGSYGLAKDPAAGAGWISKAAAQNDPYGIYFLAGLHLSGDVIPRDVNKAMVLYKRCSAMGMSQCTNMLAVHNATGRLIPQDLAESERLMELSWNQAGSEGESFAYEYAMLFKIGSSVPKSLQKSSKWFSRCPSNLACRFMGAEVREELQAAQASSRFPARPQARAGVTTCNTQCANSDCYRTYDDGRQIRFKAKQRWDAMANQFEWDAGSC